MKITRHVVTVTDFDENGNCDMKPRPLGIFNAEEDAYEFMLEDMRSYIDRNTDENGHCAFIMDDEDYEIHDEEWQNGCKYTIIPLEIELTDAEKRNAADELMGDLPF